MKKNKIGQKIQSIRENHHMSIEELSLNSGLSIEQITHIEEEVDLPALAPLLKIARALGVRLGTFLDDLEELGPVVCKGGKQNESISFSTNTANSGKHMEYYSLSGSKANRHMEPFIINIDPAAEVDFVLSSHEGEEFILVMDGEVEINYGKKNYRLEQGDSIYYDSIVPHHVHAYNGKPARILAVVYIPM